MGALIELLMPFVPALVRAAEAAFQYKPKSGADKMTAVSNALQVIAEAMLNGKVPLPDGSQIAYKSVNGDVLKGAIESVFQQLKSCGQLMQSALGNQLYLLQGCVTPLSV